MINNLSQLELFWIAICLLGLAPQLYILAVFTQAYYYLIRKNINSDRRLAARERIRTAVTFICVIGGFLIFGIVAALAPNRTEELTPQAKVFTAILIFMNCALAFSGILGVIAIKQFEANSEKHRT